MDGITLYDGERADELGRKNYRIIQNKNGFCFGVDAVLLSWFAELSPGDRAADLCSGNGIVPLLLDARYENITCTGIEIQKEAVKLAERSIRLNRAEERLQMIEGDIKEASKLLKKGEYDAVTVNPPYMAAKNGLHNPDSAKAIARHELLLSLDDVIREGALLLKPGGHFYMVHRPSRLPEILEKMRAYKLAPKKLITVHSFAGYEASMILISGKKCGHDILKVGAPLILYSSPGVSSETVKEIYGDGRH